MRTADNSGRVIDDDDDDDDYTSIMLSDFLSSRPWCVLGLRMETA